MKRTKADAMQTRDTVLDAGFQCFYQIGYERTTLTAVARVAGLSRGSVYGHFQNKEELYREVFENSLPYAEFWKTTAISNDLPFPEQLIDAFWIALNDNPNIDFLFNAIALSKSREEFADIVSVIQKIKNDLWDYINAEVTTHLHSSGRDDFNSESITSGIALIFEGMFLTKNFNTKIKLDKASISKYIYTVCAPIIDK